MFQSIIPSHINIEHNNFVNFVYMIFTCSLARTLRHPNDPNVPLYDRIFALLTFNGFVSITKSFPRYENKNGRAIVLLLLPKNEAHKCQIQFEVVFFSFRTCGACSFIRHRKFTKWINCSFSASGIDAYTPSSVI